MAEIEVLKFSHLPIDRKTIEGFRTVCGNNIFWNWLARTKQNNFKDTPEN
jgi:hypothetical protein